MNHQSVIHHFQPQVERLREQFLREERPRPHSELIELVARAEGASSWDKLDQQPRRSWLSRKFGQHWRRSSILTRKELMFDLRLNCLRIGVEPSQNSEGGQDPVDVDHAWVRRGVLLVGPNGKGTSTAIEHYASQQIARGAGLLVLDASPNDHCVGVLENLAADCGRSDFVRVGPARERDDLSDVDIAGLLSSQGTAYVSLPWQERSENTRHRLEHIVKQLMEAADESLPSPLHLRPWPFMVVVPEGGWLLTEAWLPLLQNARALGILLVIRLHSLNELESMSPELREAVMNFGTQLYLEPSSTWALDEATRALEPGLDPSKVADVRRQLSTLGMGMALLRHPEGPRHVSLCMVHDKA